MQDCLQLSRPSCGPLPRRMTVTYTSSFVPAHAKLRALHVPPFVGLLEDATAKRYQGSCNAKKNTQQFRRASLSVSCTAVQESTASEGVSSPPSGNAARNIDRATVESVTPPVHVARQRSLQRSSEFSLRVQADQDAQREKDKEKKLVHVKFWLQFHTEYGQRIKVVGSDEALGAWMLQDAPELQWSKNDRWHVEVTLPAGSVYEYKYVVLSSNGVHPVGWQRGNNSVLAIRSDDDQVEVYDNWEGQPGASVLSAGQSATREIRLRNWAAEMEAIISSQRSELRRTRMELAAAQEDARSARADATRMKTQLTRAQTDQLQSERRVRELEKHNQLLQARLAESSLSFHKAFQTAQELLSAGKVDGSEHNAADVTAEVEQTLEDVDESAAGLDDKLSGSLDFMSALRNSQFELGRSPARQPPKLPAQGRDTSKDGASAASATHATTPEKGSASKAVNDGGPSTKPGVNGGGPSEQAAPVLPNFNGSTVQQFVARLKSGLGGVVTKAGGGESEGENFADANATIDIPLRFQEQLNLARARRRMETNNGPVDGQDAST